MGMSAYVYAGAKFAMPDLVYFCTAGTTLINAGFHWYLRGFKKTAISRLEWDVATEQFAIVRPKGVMGEATKLIPVQELVFDPKRKVRDCIYYDGS
jgi:hypothetical protein